ncbi:Polyketide synthase PksH [Pyrenophora tritici-repentis]|nr:Polyketide synthase PksH [Pyrenophora tritici-repentis]
MCDGKTLHSESLLHAILDYVSAFRNISDIIDWAKIDGHGRQAKRSAVSCKRILEGATGGVIAL